MYSGITGKEFKADIYLGLVYYQRLRHMVGDKWQVRTEGPVDSVTRQPIKVKDLVVYLPICILKRSSATGTQERWRYPFRRNGA